MKHTPLYDLNMHDASVVINLKGFARAMDYTGHVAEHRATREAVSLGDVSHMGQIDFRGRDALALVQSLITNDAEKLVPGRALYSVMCDESGGVIDDLVCFRLADDHLVWVVNVTRTETDYAWVCQHAQGMDVQVSNISTETALLALQGPQSREVLQRVTRADLSALPYYWFADTTVQTDRAEVQCLVSRTGYTGEHGYEIMVGRDQAPWVWETLMTVGRPLGIVAHGVAARESLRIEAGLLLNGNDMDGETNPFEAGLGWVVKLDTDFVGRDALARIKDHGVTRKLVGLEVCDVAPVRHGYPLYAGGAEVGRVTSGPLSPPLTDRNLGLGYVATEHAEPGTHLEVDLDGRRCAARVVALPFRARRAKDEPATATWSPYALRFDPQHTWVRSDGSDTVVVGLSDPGQRRLGDVLSVELPRPGQVLRRGEPAARLDSYRLRWALPAPLSGEVVAVNSDIGKEPGRLNAYPYAHGGLFTVRGTPAELDDLLEYSDYSDVVAGQRRYDVWSREMRTF